MTALDAIEALLERRLAEGDEVDTLRQRAEVNQRFAESVQRFRDANPAAVAPRMGFA